MYFIPSTFDIFCSLPSYIQNLTICPPNLLKSNTLPFKLVKKSLGNLLREKTRLKCKTKKRKYLLSKFEAIIFHNCMKKIKNSNTNISLE